MNKTQRVLLAAIVVLFTLGTSVLSWDNARASNLAPRFHWPDETTNYFFATRVARGESLAVPESRNGAARNHIHPRTANVRGDGSIVPGSYLGLPLWYGIIGRVLGERAMLLVTPILAALGLLAFASIVRRLAGATVAVTATALLAFSPSLWLFTATAMLPNVPFVALLLLGFAALIGKEHSNAPNAGFECSKYRWRIRSIWMRFEAFGCTLYWFLAGLLLGLALTIRTHEFLWVFALFVFFAQQSQKQKMTPRVIFWQRAIMMVIGAAIPFIPILILNAQLYGSPFTTGYALLQENGAAPTEFTPSLLPGWLSALVAPFGWHPLEAFARFWTYMVVPYSWFVVLAVVGMIGTAVRLSPPTPPPLIEGRGGAGGRGAMVVAILTALWLILYYGSWTIADPLVRETNVLTISYVRYWLPIMVLLAPWAAGGFLAIVNRIPTRWRSYAIGLVFLGIASTAFAQVVTDPAEGLLRQRQALDEHRQRARAVIVVTPPDAVIISHRMDKVFFPERAVVHAPVDPTSDGSFVSRLRALADTAPTYWYATGTPSLSGFTFTAEGVMPFGEQLYRVE